MLWLRKYRILITDKNDKEALDVSDLHCVFEVHKRRSQGASYAIVRIYNLSAEAEKMIINDGDRVIIEAGYKGTQQSVISGGSTDDWTLYSRAGLVGEQGQSVGDNAAVPQYGVIFDGQVIYPTRAKETNADYVLTLSCVDGNQPLNFNYIQKSINKGMNQRQIFDVVCNSGDVPIPAAHVTDGLSEQVLPRGKVFFGQPVDYIEDICRGNGALYFMDGGNVNIYKLTDVADDEALVIDPYTGLIGIPQQTVNGLNFRVLLNPSIKLMTKIKLARSEVQEQTITVGQRQRALDDEWIYQAIEVIHRGDSLGNDWYTEIVGISRYGAGSLPSILANAETNPNGT